MGETYNSRFFTHKSSDGSRTLARSGLGWGVGGDVGGQCPPSVRWLHHPTIAILFFGVP